MFAAFLAAALLLAITPGPGVVYIVARTVSQGRAAGVASVLGVGCGNFGNAVGASLGLAALFAASTLAFTLVKLAGAGYLVWLGLRLLWAPASSVPWVAGDAPPAGMTPPAALPRLFRDGAVVALLNPKTALFFAAFLPQFMPNHAPAWAEATSLAAIFVAIAAITDLAYVLLAASIAARLGGFRTAARWGRWASGAAFIGLGLASASGSPPAAH